MDQGRRGFIVGAFLFLFFGFERKSLANKSSVTIEAPAAAHKGAEVVIKLNVFHNGNNFFHYTEWVYAKINGKEVARWQFTPFDRPEAENFSREVKVSVTEKLDIVAEANCVIHGSAGQANFVVAPN